MHHPLFFQSLQYQSKNDLHILLSARGFSFFLVILYKHFDCLQIFEEQTKKLQKENQRMPKTPEAISDGSH